MNVDFRYDTVVVGGGQTGLSTGYYLRQQGRDFVILDANPRIGDAWRQRWDSLRLFTPARFCSLPGMPFPAPRDYFPTKDEMGDYLEAYAERFALPVWTGMRVDGLTKPAERFILTAGGKRFEADNVVVAMANYQKANLPSFAHELAADIVQLHSSQYKNLTQLKKGAVLIVGAGNSGAEIAMETAKVHETWLSGRHPGHIPFRIDSLAARLFLVWFVLRVIFHRVLTESTPMGRNFRKKMLNKGGPLVRTKPEDLVAAGIARVGRTTGVKNGRPVLDDGRVLDVANVVWCTGYHAGYSWIDLPVLREGTDEPLHRRGVVPSMPGLYFVGRRFTYAASSEQIHGSPRDTAYIAEQIAARSEQPAAEAPQASAGKVQVAG